MTNPLVSEAAKIEAVALAPVQAEVAKVEHYEMSLFSFVTDHTFIALQLALIVAVPVAFIAFEIGKRIA
jgi:hypothetical protein